MKRELEREGRAATAAHSGQSMLAEAFTSPPLPSTSIIFIPPPAEQTISTPTGLITGEATAEARNSANHASTMLAMSFELRRAFMTGLWHQWFESLAPPKNDVF